MRSFLLILMVVGLFTVSQTLQAQNPGNPGDKKSSMKQKPGDTVEKKMSNDVSVTGEIIDTKCYVTGMMGGRGPEHEECAISCIKGGLPVGLLDGKGNVYTLVPAKGMKGANEALLPYVAKNVTVNGKVAEKGGAKLLVYSSVEEVK